MPRAVRRAAYRRVPETCDTVRAVLDKMADEICTLARTCDLADPAEHPAVDAIVSRAFVEIRDTATLLLRRDQMRALYCVYRRKLYERRRSVLVADGFKYYSTPFADRDQRLLFAHVEGTNLGYPGQRRRTGRQVSFWSFFHQWRDDEPRRVGREYPSRETLLADMMRYGREYGFK